MPAPRLLLIDNYDSFTYNLVQAFMVLGAEVLVHRNDAITVEDAAALAPTHLCISPGPGTPREAGVSMEMIEPLPVGCRCSACASGTSRMVEVFGGEVVRAGRLMHGKVSLVEHDGAGVFAGLPRPFAAGRYHSLIARPETLARGARGDGAHAGGRDHGRPSSRARRRRRAVPSRRASSRRRARDCSATSLRFVTAAALAGAADERAARRARAAARRP